jgi:hypothetical protein
MDMVDEVDEMDSPFSPGSPCIHKVQLCSAFAFSSRQLKPARN